MNFEAVIFDCDGVLVDSETISAEVLTEMMCEMGCSIDVTEVARHFVGRTMKDELGWIAHRAGATLAPGWLLTFQQRRNLALTARLQPMPGAVPAVAAVSGQYDGRIACASSGDRKKIRLQLAKVGLLGYFDGRICSGYEVAHSKPAPDVYLAACTLLAVDPARCLVVEDSVPGVAAGLAAGATVLGYAPASPAHDGARALLEAGASAVFADMRQLAMLTRSRLA